jgi:RsiW-degrading membrane proteinase PrsW (M82 family)
MFFGALWGYALGTKLVHRNMRTWPWLLLAALCHGLFDALLSTEGAGTLAVLLNLVLASTFIVLVRRALRHGVVNDAVLAVRPEERTLYRVGRPALFWASAVLFHVCALGIFLLGAYYQLARHRPGALFVGGSSVLLALLAVTALGFASTMPLDVAVDSYGVTFAGAARSWDQIRAIAIEGDRVALQCEAGPIFLGPAPQSTLERIARDLRARLGY